MAGNCPRMNACPMFPVFKMASALRVWQVRFCESRFEDCVRYQKTNCGESVPPTLLPTGEVLQVGGAGGGAAKKA